MKTQKVFILLCVLLFLSPFFCHAADYYIAQAEGGSGDASSCNNAKAYTWDWTSPTVNDGDTVHLCGTIANTLTIPKSGRSIGITVKFEGGARLSAAYWGTGSRAAIYSSGKSYINIDGNNTGIIEAMANGDSLSNQQVSNGIDITGGTNWEIKNLTIQNIYVHDYNNNSHVRSRCISLTDSSIASIHDNTLNDAYYGIVAVTSGLNVSALNLYSNAISACSTGIVVALGNNGTSIDTVNINNNTITMGLNWFDTPNSNHIDGIHVWGRSETLDQVTNLKVYNNKIGGNPSTHSTAAIFLENEIISPQIYNNVLWNTTNHHADGFIYLKGNETVTGSNAKIYNNTLSGAGSGLAIELGHVTGIDVRNNIIYQTDYIISEDDGSVTKSACNYNDYYPTGNQSRAFSLAGVTKTWAEWQTAGWDANSITTDPLLDAFYKLKVASPAIGAATALNGTFTTDKDGVLRGIIWDIGAYKYIDVSPTPSPVPSPSNSGGGGGGCFIATAAFGSYLDPHIIILRDFRDSYLLTNSLGQAFVNYYYRYSPPIADVINKHESLKSATRWALIPVVYSVEHPYLMTVSLIIPAGIGLAYRRR
jgi:hypothetical protein